MHADDAIPQANQAPVGPPGKGIAIELSQVRSTTGASGISQEVIELGRKGATIRRYGKKIRLDCATELFTNEQQVGFALAPGGGRLMLSHCQVACTHRRDTDQQAQQCAPLLTTGRSGQR
jgi:hypothetical protein